MEENTKSFGNYCLSNLTVAALLRFFVNDNVVVFSNSNFRLIVIGHVAILISMQCVDGSLVILKYFDYYRFSNLTVAASLRFFVNDNVVVFSNSNYRLIVICHVEILMSMWCVDGSLVTLKYFDY